MSSTGKAPGPIVAKTRVPPQLRPHVFKPGQVANPGGRPKGSGTFAGELAAILGEEVEDLGTAPRSSQPTCDQRQLLLPERRQLELPVASP